MITIFKTQFDCSHNESFTKLHCVYTTEKKKIFDEILHCNMGTR